MSDQFIEYTEILKTELLTRTQRNPRYSLRAFARDLGISAARLSRILAKKAGHPRATAIKIGENLGYREEKLEWYCALVRAQSGKTQEDRQAAKNLLTRFDHGVATKRLSAQGSIDWNWYHFAIRRLTQLSGFRSDCEWISRKLGIGWRQTKKAVEELVRIGALAIVDGQIEVRQNYSVFFNGDKSGVREKMEKDLFARQLPSVLSPARDRAHHARHYFALNEGQIQELKNLIKSFEDQVDDLTYKSQNPEELYCLTLDLWSLLDSKVEKKPLPAVSSNPI